MRQGRLSITTNQIKGKDGKQALKEFFFENGSCLNHPINKNKTKI